MSEIRIDTEGLNKNAGNFKQYSENYLSELSKIKENVEGLKPYWTDAAGTEFFTKFDTKYDVVKEMGPAIEGLGEAVSRTKDQMNTSIDESISAFK